MDQGGEGEIFSDPEGGLNCFHASLANIFNKCHKKLFSCLMYIKYELEGGSPFILLHMVIVF